MDSSARAASLFEGRFSCTQSIAALFGPRYGLEEASALRLARGFGMGQAKGLTCGAVTGAYMVLGLALGPVEGNDREARYRCYDLIREFDRRFSARHGTLSCSELLGLDMDTEAGRQEAGARNLFRTACPNFVRDAAAILDEMIAGLDTPAPPVTSEE
ncbi:MAG: C-GCAxxG-C-C family protein [Proteobacteria bacterium]|nr:C-GCAxxG-C-C family protein [Pseudomonadota bacterium]